MVSAAFAGSLGTAWVIQRAILGVCMKALTVTRSSEAASVKQAFTSATRVSDSSAVSGAF